MTAHKPSDSIRDDGKPTYLYWLVTLLALCWGSFVVIDYYLITTKNAAYLNHLPEDHLSFINDYPYWRQIIWLLASVFAFLGGLFMLFRNRFSVTFLWIAALLSIGGFIGYEILLSPGVETMDEQGLIWTVCHMFGSLILAMYASRCWDDDLLK